MTFPTINSTTQGHSSTSMPTFSPTSAPSSSSSVSVLAKRSMPGEPQEGTRPLKAQRVQPMESPAPVSSQVLVEDFLTAFNASVGEFGDTIASNLELIGKLEQSLTSGSNRHLKTKTLGELSILYYRVQNAYTDASRKETYLRHSIERANEGLTLGIDDLQFNIFLVILLSRGLIIRNGVDDARVARTKILEALNAPSDPRIQAVLIGLYAQAILRDHPTPFDLSLAIDRLNMALNPSINHLCQFHLNELLAECHLQREYQGDLDLAINALTQAILIPLPSKYREETIIKLFNCLHKRNLPANSQQNRPFSDYDLIIQYGQRELQFHQPGDRYYERIYGYINHPQISKTPSFASTLTHNPSIPRPATLPIPQRTTYAVATFGIPFVAPNMMTTLQPNRPFPQPAPHSSPIQAVHSTIGGYLNITYDKMVSSTMHLSRFMEEATSPNVTPASVRVMAPLASLPTSSPSSNALERMKEIVNLHVNLLERHCQMLFLKNDFDEAIKLLSATLETPLDSIQKEKILTILAEAYEKRGEKNKSVADLELAEQTLNKALELLNKIGINA